MKLRPIGERALVKPVEQGEETAPGIVLPGTVKDKPRTARVIAVGDPDDASVNEGDPSAFARYSGTGIALDDEDYLILDADDLLGIVEE